MSSSYSFYWPGAFRHALDQVRYFVTRTSDDRSVGLVRVGEYLVQFTIVFAAYLIAGKLGQATTNLRSSNLGPVWPAYGIALGAVLVCGYQIWPAIAAAVFLVALWSPESALTALGQATGSTLAALSGAFLLRRVKFHNSLSRLRDVLALVLLGALGSAIVSASAGVSVLYASHVHAYSGPGSAWLIYWLGDSTGVLLVTPLVLTFPTLFRIRDGHRLREFAVLLLLLTATSFAAFGLLPLIPSRLHHMAFAVLPFVMWAAIRFGMSVTALSIFLVTTIATVETALGSGPFTTNTPLMNAVLLDIFFGVVSVTGLSLAAAVAEREHAEREREGLVREQAEAEARLRFAAIVESCEDAIISGTLDGIIVSWNGGAQRIYGYTEAEAVGKPIAILLPPELADEENKILETLRAEGRIEHFETVRVTKTGKRINVSLTISAIRDSSGRTVGISGIARDISELKRHEQELRSSEERLRLAQQAARLGTFERNVRTGRITWAEGLDSLYGLPPGSVDGKTLAFFKDLIHPADRERVAHLIQEALKTGQPTEGEWRAIWPDKSVHWIAGRWQVLMDDSGEPSRVVGLNMDVTERKLAEQALHAHEELLKIFVKNVPVAVAMLDHELRYLQVSDRWCSDNAVEAQELLGRPREAFPEMPERWKEVNRRALQGETLRADEDSWESAGSTRWARWEVRPWRKPDGNVGGILVFAEDITHRKQMEETLSGMTRKLIEAQEQERARIGRELHDDINQRLAMLAVELEQPLDPSEFPNRVQGFREELRQISDDVQALSHDLHSTKLEYLGVIAGMKSWCKEFAQRQKMDVDFKSDLRSVLPLDIGRPLFRVLQEALHNSFKHSGVKRIEVRLQEGSGEIQLTISDLGIGFDLEAALRGKGLGLTSMRERVRLVNGTISIESKPMGGTTVHVRIPLAPEHGSQRAAG